MGFSEILGHKKQLDALRFALASGRLHHAYLFVGPEGVGKRTIALSLAKAIHCDAVQGDFCDECVNCARVMNANHPDVRSIMPLPGKKEIAIQQIRDIEKELSFRSFSGKRKIIIIDPAVLMNVSAQSALLKTLEEPPNDSLLILVSPHGGALLPTVRSRCLRVGFAPLPQEVIARYLMAGKSVGPEDARLIAAICNGSLGMALRLDDKVLIDMRRRWVERLNSLRPSDYRAALNAAESLSANREESLKFLEWLEGWYRDLLAHAVGGASAELINLDMISQLAEHAEENDLADVLELMRLALGATARIQRNLNRRMILEEVFLKAVEER